MEATSNETNTKNTSQVAAQMILEQMENQKFTPFEQAAIVMELRSLIREKAEAAAKSYADLAKTL
nr:hypothetical protein [uncultured Arsenicibacter sp.]